MKKITLILFILLTGCTSVSNIKEIDFSITGLEMEFYPSTPEQPDITIWDRRSDIERIYREKKFGGSESIAFEPYIRSYI